MAKTYSLPRLKTITSYSGYARWIAETSDEPVAFLARAQVADIPSPYAYSPSKAIYEWKGKRVVSFETAHRRYEIFEVPADWTVFTSDAVATDHHIATTR